MSTINLVESNPNLILTCIEYKSFQWITKKWPNIQTSTRRNKKAEKTHCCLNKTSPLQKPIKLRAFNHTGSESHYSKQNNKISRYNQRSLLLYFVLKKLPPNWQIKIIDSNSNPKPYHSSPSLIPSIKIFQNNHLATQKTLKHVKPTTSKVS